MTDPTNPPGGAAAADETRKLFESTFHEAPLPPGAEEYLRYDNPRLLELERRYAALGIPAIDHSLWSDWFRRQSIDPRYFRGDNAYLWQYRGEKSLDVVEIKYLLTAYYLEKIDALGLLRTLAEDDLFGVYTFDFNGRPVSRDLLDSLAEIYFLERHVGLSKMPRVSMLDVGAGYGRLAHRATAALPNVERYLCVDGVAVSTFLSEYYLRFRGAEPRAAVVPLDELERTLAETAIDVAVNVHSFSECTLDAIDWWLGHLERRGVRHLFIVPNDGRVLRSREKDGRMLDYRPRLEAHGYRLLADEPKYLDPTIQRLGIHPAHHYLFELSGR